MYPLKNEANQPVVSELVTFFELRLILMRMYHRKLRRLRVLGHYLCTECSYRLFSREQQASRHRTSVYPIYLSRFDISLSSELVLLM